MSNIKLNIIIIIFMSFLYSLWIKANDSVKIYKNSQLNGKVIQKYTNGKKKRESHYKNGVKNGKETYWKRESSKQNEDYPYKTIVNYINGKKEGKETIWNKDGSKKSELNYKEGIINK